MLEAVIAEGATTINMPDTVGYAIPELYGHFIRNLRERIPNSDKAIWSVHCHNDLGMAVANSLAGVKIGGARQVECTINGLGERAGNCSLEEVVMAVKTRRDYFGLELRIDTSQIVPASRLVSADHRLRRAAEQGRGRRQRLRACVRHPPGRRAQGARHLRDHACRGRGLERQQDRARQAVRPQCLQAAPAGTGHRARESEADVNAAFARFKELADRKSDIFDEDILALVSDESVTTSTSTIGCCALSQRSETGERPHASVVFAAGAVEHHARKRRQRPGRRESQGDRVAR